MDQADLRGINLQQKLKSVYLGDEKRGNWWTVEHAPPEVFDAETQVLECCVIVRKVYKRRD